MILNVNCLFSNVNHEYTKEVFREWCRKNYGKPIVVRVDWGNMSPREMQKLSEKMFDAVKKSQVTCLEYYRTLKEFFVQFTK